MNKDIEKEFLLFYENEGLNINGEIEYFDVSKTELIKLMSVIICICISMFIIFYYKILNWNSFGEIVLMIISILIPVYSQFWLTYLHEVIHSLSIRIKKKPFDIIIDKKTGKGNVVSKDWVIFNIYEAIAFFINPLIFYSISASLIIFFVDINLGKMIAFNILLLEIYGSSADIYIVIELLRRYGKIKSVILPDSKYNYSGIVFK